MVLFYFVSLKVTETMNGMRTYSIFRGGLDIG